MRLLGRVTVRGRQAHPSKGCAGGQHFLEDTRSQPCTRNDGKPTSANHERPPAFSRVTAPDVEAAA